MRRNFIVPDVHLLQYQIREIVEVAHQIQKLNPSQEITWENIGDPIAKGWRVPDFLKEILEQEIRKPSDGIFGYTHSRGLPSAREWVCQYTKKFAPSSILQPDDILFSNGLGSAIAALYQMLPDGVRILQPMPAYPTHVSFESFRHRSEPLLYRLDPQHNWEPDIHHIEEQVQAHPEVGGILLINPNNPTGSVYSKEVLEKVVTVAQKYGLMIISDEIYFRLVYPQFHHEHMIEVVAGRVPLIVMRGVSKDVPWPGARCGWLEFHNTQLDTGFVSFVEALKKRMLLEVCATTMPQMILAQLYTHPAFEEWLSQYVSELERTSKAIGNILAPTRGLKVNPTQGAFYMVPSFEEGVLSDTQHLPIAHPDVRAYIEQLVSHKDIPLDQRFVYYLLGATGICVVPATGFYSPWYGFRVTTLDRDPVRRERTYTRLREAIEEYIQA